MLRASEEPGCSKNYQFWASADGVRAFHSRVHALGANPHTDDATSALRNALVGAAFLEADELEERVHGAASHLARRIHGEERRSHAFSAFVRSPQPPRHAVYAGGTDRGDTREDTPPWEATTATQKHRADYLSRVAERRASGRHARLYAGVAQDSATLPP